MRRNGFLGKLFFFPDVETQNKTTPDPAGKVIINTCIPATWTAKVNQCNVQATWLSEQHVEAHKPKEVAEKESQRTLSAMGRRRARGIQANMVHSLTTIYFSRLSVEKLHLKTPTLKIYATLWL